MVGMESWATALGTGICSNKYCLFFARKVFKSYDSKYLKVLNNTKPLYDRGTFNSLELTDKEIKYIYRDKL